MKNLIEKTRYDSSDENENKKEIYKQIKIIENQPSIPTNPKNKLNDEKYINEDESKEELKNPQKLSEYLKKQKVNVEELEILDCFDSGSESNAYNLLINYKNKKGISMKKKAVMKVIFNDKRKREKENKKEAYISSILKNNNIINFYGYSKIKEGYTSYMIMEIGKYGNLRNFQRNVLKRRIFSESMICFIANQILNGIIYCHKCKIAHMDIKPQNVVVDEFLNTKLIDFSISINYKNKKLNEEMKIPFRGTNFYMSKEVLNTETIKIRDLNKIDLYAFGVLLYNLAFGKYPYNLSHGDEENYEAIIKKIENEKLTFPDTKDYSSHFLDFISKLLEKDIDKRINIYEALNHYWIKGAKIILDEKENCNNIGIFFSYLLTNHIKSFNNYIQKSNEKEENEREKIQNIF